MNFLKRFDVFYFVTLLFLLLTSNANFLSVNNVYWFAALVLMIILAIAKKRIGTKELRIFSVLSFFYLVLTGARDILLNNLDADFLLSDVIFFFKYIIFSFVYVTLLKKETITYIVRVMTDLTVVSLFFYFLQLIGFADVFNALSQSLNLSIDTGMPGYSNIVVFTFISDLHDYQNSGFAWEPGAFGCFLSITLLLHFFSNQFRFDRSTKILILGIITTFSTTTYLALLVILFLAYRYRYPKQNKWLLLLVPLFILLMVAIPLLGEKIGETYYNDIDALNRLMTLERYYHKHNELIPLNRFASMMYVYQSFGSQLIAGMCTKYDVILNRKLEVDISNGIADFIARFGVIGFLFLVYRFTKFCQVYIKKAELLLYCIVVLLVVGFGEPLLQLPIILIFLFLAMVYADKNETAKAPQISPASYEPTRI